MKKLFSKLFPTLVACFFIISLLRSDYDIVIFISGIVLMAVGFIDWWLNNKNNK